MRYVRINLGGVFSTNSAQKLILDFGRTLGYVLRQAGSVSEPSLTLHPPA